MTERIKKIIFKNKEILFIDYSGCRDNAMIDIITAAKELILKENKKVLIMSVFKGSYITPGFIRHVEVELKKAEPLIERNALTGLTDVQMWILKGINLWYKKQLHHFDSLDEGLEYLVS